MPINPTAGPAAAMANTPATTGATMFGSDTKPEATAPNGTLDKDAFLQLLVASMKYQDPTAPMDTSELMAQTTQLATMEQLTEITQLSKDSFDLQLRNSATSLIGNQVLYQLGGEPMSGVVQGVEFSAGEPSVIVDGLSLPLSAVSAVAAPPAGSAPATPGPTAPPADAPTSPADSTDTSDS